MRFKYKRYDTQVLLLFENILRRYPEILNEDLVDTISSDNYILEFIRSQISERDDLRQRIETYQVTVVVTQIAPISNRQDRHASPIGKYEYVVNSLDQDQAESIALDVFNRNVSIGTPDDFLIDIETVKIESRMPVS